MRWRGSALWFFFASDDAKRRLFFDDLFERYGPGVIPVVSNIFPEINGFYRITEDSTAERVPAWRITNHKVTIRNHTPTSIEVSYDGGKTWKLHRGQP